MFSIAIAKSSIVPKSCSSWGYVITGRGPTTISRHRNADVAEIENHPPATELRPKLPENRTICIRKTGRLAIYDCSFSRNILKIILLYCWGVPSCGILLVCENRHNQSVLYEAPLTAPKRMQMRPNSNVSSFVFNLSRRGHAPVERSASSNYKATVAMEPGD